MKPFYRRANDWWELREIADEHGEAELLALLTTVLEGRPTAAQVLKAQCEIEVWNNMIEEREEEETLMDSKERDKDESRLSEPERSESKRIASETVALGWGCEVAKWRVYDYLLGVGHAGSTALLMAAEIVRVDVPIDMTDESFPNCELHSDCHCGKGP